MSAQQITVDFSLFTELEKYFGDRGNDVSSMNQYLDQFVKVSNPLGFLLQKLIAPFLEGRTAGLGALQQVLGLMQHLSQTMPEYANDVKQQEQAYLKLLNDLLALAEQHSSDARNVMTGDGSGGVTGPVTAADMAAAGLTTAGATATGVAATGLGATGLTPTSSTGYTPADLTTPGLNPVTTQTPAGTTATGTDASALGSGASSASVTIHDAGGDTITVTPGSDGQPVSVHDGGDTYTVSHGADGGLTVDVSHDSSTAITETPSTPEQSSILDRIWGEQAANDPLGRSASELQAAWESRELPPMPTDTSVGFDQTTGELPATPASSLAFA